MLLLKNPLCSEQDKAHIITACSQNMGG